MFSYVKHQSFPLPGLTPAGCLHKQGLLLRLCRTSLANWRSGVVQTDSHLEVSRNLFCLFDSEAKLHKERCYGPQSTRHTSTWNVGQPGRNIASAHRDPGSSPCSQRPLSGSPARGAPLPGGMAALRLSPY